MTEESKAEGQTPAAPQEGAPEAAAEKSAAAKAPTTFRALLGRKMGMTQIFTKDGELKAVTIVSAGPCPVVRVKESDGPDHYSAVILGYGARREKNATKPELGQFVKAGIKPMRYVREFRLDDPKGFAAGQVVDFADRFAVGDYVDVQSRSKGKGFAGAMKRHGFHGMPASHGSSDKERSPGSLAARRSLGRVLPGQRMAGHMGFVTTTVQKIEVIEVAPEKNLIYLNGSVPGANGSLVTIRETVKNRKRRRVHQATKKELKASEILKAQKAKGMKSK